MSRYHRHRLHSGLDGAAASFVLGRALLGVPSATRAAQSERDVNPIAPSDAATAKMKEASRSHRHYHRERIKRRVWPGVVKSAPVHEI